MGPVVDVVNKKSLSVAGDVVTCSGWQSKQG
jgi:hypothetical protein